MNTRDQGSVQTTQSDALKAKLEEVIHKSASFRNPTPSPDLLTALDDDDLFASRHALWAIKNWGDEVQPLLVVDERFPGNEVKCVSTGNGCHGFYPKLCADKLVRRAIESNSADQAIAWLQKVLSTQTATGHYITALWNVPVDAEIQLTPTVSIIPFEQVPDSRHKRALGPEAIFRSFRIWFDMETPSSALVIRQQVTPFVRELGGDYPNNTGDLWSQVNDVIDALTLIGPRIPIHAANWYSFDDPDIELALEGSGRGGRTMEIIPKSNTEKLPELNVEEARLVIEKYCALAPEAKTKAGIAIHRLRHSLARHQAGESAIEICIAFEILLADGERGNIGKYVGQRGAKLLSNDPQEQSRVSELLEQIYKIRNELVHRGKQMTDPIEIGGQTLAAGKITHQASLLCADIIKKLILGGGI